jgi:hypothetical protein
MVMQERVRERTDERSGREALIAKATQEIGASDSEAIRQTILAKIDADEAILTPPETAEDSLAADLLGGRREE